MPPTATQPSSYRRSAVYGLIAAIAVAGFATWRGAIAPAGGNKKRGPEIEKRPGLASPPLPGPPDAPSSITDVARKALPSIVSLQCNLQSGSGFFVTADMVMTNAHVLCGTYEPLEITLSDGRKAQASPARRDERLDLALVQVAGTTATPLELGDAGTLSAGDPVLVVASPMGYQFRLHQAAVSSPARHLLGVSYVQIDAHLNPGNSGGPLLDRHGRVVGVVSLKQRDAAGVGLAIPINYAFADQAGFVSGPETGPTPGFAAMLAGAAESARR